MVKNIEITLTLSVRISITGSYLQARISNQRHRRLKFSFEDDPIRLKNVWQGKWNLSVLLFWAVTACGLVSRYRRFG
jgi:hypothetical protein